MAHFAELNSSNEVLQVVVISNNDVDANGGDESAQAETFVASIVPHSEDGTAWKQTSYNNNFRKQYAGIGYSYNSSKDKELNKGLDLKGGIIQKILNIGTVQNVGAGGYLQLANAEKMVDIAQPATATDIFELTTQAKYSNLNQSGYWVGQKLDITGTINKNPGTQVFREITAIVQNADGSLTLTFNSLLFTLTATDEGAKGMTIDNVGPTTQDAEFTRMECELKQMPDGVEASKNVLYTKS